MRRFLVLCMALAGCAPFLCGAQQPTSRLDVTVQPEGARVFVDGQDRGASPCSLFDIAAGTHFIHVEAPTYVSDDAFVTVEAGGFVQKSFALAEEKGLVLVRTEPSGADVKYKGVSLGTTPLLVTSLASGRTHVLELALTGYQVKKIDVKTEGRRPLVREEKLALDSGVVNCTTEPAGATVVVNGVERGVTPILLTNIPKGLATVTFRLGGYADETRELRLAPGESQTLAVKMKGRPARLTVVSTPEQAKVFVDNDYQGKTPTTIAAVAPGQHEIRVALEGHGEAKRTVTLENGGESTEEFALESVMSRIEVVTTPPGVKILLDGKAVGSTRSQGGDATRSQILALENVPAGERSLLARLDGYRDTSRRVIVKAGETSKLFLRLSRIFQPDTEVETIRGIHRGVLVERDALDNLVLEVSPGVQQTFRHEDIRKVTPLSK